MRQPVGLYVHVPFCASKCAYCDFASYAGREADIPRYVDAVVREIARRGDETGHPSANTIFLGGGTPSLLSDTQVKRILEALFKAFPIEADAEITCECNPGSLATSFAEVLHEAGVNRLSLGAQAAQSHLLRLLGRAHRWQEVVDSVEIARHAGFENLNLDLMFGLPSQTVSDLQATLEAAIALGSTHLSCYSLMVEDGTPICHAIDTGRLALPDEETDRAMYELARRVFAEYDFHQYEISNFARDGYACRHNLGCWTRTPYLGFGCAAHSFFDETRTRNPSSIDAYLAGTEPRPEPISREQARFESMMLGLRLARGVKDAEFAQMHGMGIRDAFGGRLDKPIRKGLLQWHQGALRLTPLGMNLMDSVLLDLM